MRSEDIFALDLGLIPPWEVSKVEFVQEPRARRSIFISISGKAESLSMTPVRSKRPMTRKTRRGATYECYLYCRVPRIMMSNGKYKMVEVPWTRSKSEFTLLFEAYIMMLVESGMPVAAVSKTVTAPCIWRMFHHWVKNVRAAIDLSEVRRIGVDETSSRKGHKYITQFVDLDTRRLIFATEGKGEETFAEFVKELEPRGDRRENIQVVVSMDLSGASLPATLSILSHVSLVFDKFHIMKLLNNALDDIRKAEKSDKTLPKRHRFTFLWRKANLRKDKLEELETLLLTYPEQDKVYQYKEGFFDALFHCPTAEESIAYLGR